MCELGRLYLRRQLGPVIDQVKNVLQVAAEANIALAPAAKGGQLGGQKIHGGHNQDTRLIRKWKGNGVSSA